MEEGEVNWAGSHLRCFRQLREVTGTVAMVGNGKKSALGSDWAIIGLSFVRNMTPQANNVDEAVKKNSFNRTFCLNDRTRSKAWTKEMIGTLEWDGNRGSDRKIVLKTGEQRSRKQHMVMTRMLVWKMEGSEVISWVTT